MIRRDKCKCGKNIIWNDDYSAPPEVICKFCKTKFSVQSDDITVFWLEEKISSQIPWKTKAR